MIDKLYSEAEKLVKNSENICIGNFQRKFLIGYNRASRLMESLIEKGVVQKEIHDFGVIYKLTHNN